MLTILLTSVAMEPTDFVLWHTNIKCRLYLYQDLRIYCLPLFIKSPSYKNIAFSWWQASSKERHCAKYSTLLKWHSEFNDNHWPCYQWTCTNSFRCHNSGLTSAGCCTMYRHVETSKGCTGRYGHRHTFWGRLREEKVWRHVVVITSPFQLKR